MIVGISIRDRFLHLPDDFVPRDGKTRVVILQNRENGKFEVEKTTEAPGKVVREFR